MAYTRFFLSLENEASGFGFKGRTPVGSCIVESRDNAGKISVRAQDIKTQTRFGVYLIFPDGGRYTGISMGTLNADEKGRAEVRKDFTLSELGKHSLEELVGVAVIVEPVDTPSIISPLCGYRDRVVSWRGSFSENKKIEEVKVTPKTEIAPPKVAPPEVASVEVAPMEIEPTEVTPTEVAPPDILPPEAPPMEVVPMEASATEVAPMEVAPMEVAPMEVAPMEVAPMEVAPMEAPATEVAPMEVAPLAQTAPRTRKSKNSKLAPKNEISQESIVAINEKGDSPPANTENLLAIEKIFNTKTHITPFENFSREVTWVQLGSTDAVPLPENRSLLLEEPFVCAAYANHDHVLLGITSDGAEYIIGVPCEYNPQERHQAKRLGFSQFKANANDPPKRGDEGYWLMVLPV